MTFRKEFRKGRTMKKWNKNLLDELFEERIKNALEISLLKNKDYKNALNISNELAANLEEQNLSKDQKFMVDDILSANNFTSSIYGKEAYKQGFKDAITLIYELCKSV